MQNTESNHESNHADNKRQNSTASSTHSSTSKKTPGPTKPHTVVTSANPTAPKTPKKRQRRTSPKNKNKREGSDKDKVSEGSPGGAPRTLPIGGSQSVNGSKEEEEQVKNMRYGGVKGTVGVVKGNRTPNVSTGTPVKSLSMDTHTMLTTASTPTLLLSAYSN